MCTPGKQRQHTLEHQKLSGYFCQRILLRKCHTIPYNYIPLHLYNNDFFHIIIYLYTSRKQRQNTLEHKKTCRSI